MKTRKNRGSENEGARDGAAEKAYREKIAALVLRRSALSDDERALFRELSAELLDLHYDRIWGTLVNRGVPDAEREDLLHDVFITFILQVHEQGFPEHIGAKLCSIASDKARNKRRRERQSPVQLGPPSSTSEKPRSTPEMERVMDRVEIRRRLVSALSPEHKKVIAAVILDEMTHEEAALELGISRSTLTTRLKAAREKLAAIAGRFLPRSQRKPR